MGKTKGPLRIRFIEGILWFWKEIGRFCFEVLFEDEIVDGVLKYAF